MNTNVSSHQQIGNCNCFHTRFYWLLFQPWCYLYHLWVHLTLIVILTKFLPIIFHPCFYHSALLNFCKTKKDAKCSFLVYYEKQYVTCSKKKFTWCPVML